MKKIAIILGVTVALAVEGVAFSANIASLAWNQSNIETLRSFDKAAVFGFITDGHPTFDFTAKNIWEFGWFDLAGDRKYELALITGSRCCVYLTVYWQDAPDRVRRQSFAGAGKLSSTIRDLNGDGKDELILDKTVVENNAQLKFYWPAVYRLNNGKYVEASRDFPNFYDNEVLPELDKQISEAQARITTGPQPYQAGLIMERDKILRVLGRNPTAGLPQAYEWMNSDDPDLLQDAEVTFMEVGGHEAEARATQEKGLRVFCGRSPGTAICKSAPKR